MKGGLVSGVDTSARLLASIAASMLVRARHVNGR